MMAAGSVNATLYSYGPSSKDIIARTHLNGNSGFDAPRNCITYSWSEAERVLNVRDANERQVLSKL